MAAGPFSPVMSPLEGSMEVEYSYDEAVSSKSSTSMCSSPRACVSGSFSSSVSSDSLSENEALRFKPEQYLAMHKKALAERARYGGCPPRMRMLYRYWCEFLQFQFNDAMYRSFLVLAQEDAAEGHVVGLRHLFIFFKKRLASSFDAELFGEFEQLAHRYHDYMDFEYGIRCLLELLTMGTSEVVSASGCSLDPMTVALLEAWGSFVDGCHQGGGRTSDSGSADTYTAMSQGTEGDEHPRVRLHRQLAEKRKKRSKARPAAVPAASPVADDVATAITGDSSGSTVAGAGAVGDVAEVGMAGKGTEGTAEGNRAARGGRAFPRQRAAGVGDKGGVRAGSLQRSAAVSVQKKMTLCAKAQPWVPQAQARMSCHPEAQRLPDRLGERLGN